MKIRESGLPFDDFRALMSGLPAADENALELTKTQVQERLGGAESVLGSLCEWYAAWSGRSPVITRPVLTLFAGTHAVDSSNDGLLLEEVTEISSGSSVINGVCHQHDLGLKVLDLALQIPVADITSEAALDEKSCAGTIAFGMEAIAGGADLLCAAALETKPNASVLALMSVRWGLSIDDALLLTDSQIGSKAKQAASLAEKHAADGFEVLRRLGGREAAALCGAILAARSQHIPVLLAGPTALASAAILESMEAGATSHCKLAQPTGIAGLDKIAEQAGLSFVSRDFLSHHPAIQLALAAGIMKTACLALAKSN